MERLWERSEEGRKETNSDAKYRNRERMHGKPGRAERGKPRKRMRNRSTAQATVRRKQEEKGKEETEGQVAGSGEEADERKRKVSGKYGSESGSKHLWTSCGSEAGKDERKQTESQVREPGKSERETSQE